MSLGGQRVKRHRNIAENFNHLSRVHERYRRQTDRRQTTDGRTTTYSERSRSLKTENIFWEDGLISSKTPLPLICRTSKRYYGYSARPQRKLWLRLYV